MTMSDISRLDFLSAEVVVSNWAAILARVSVFVTCTIAITTIHFVTKSK